MLFSLLYNGFVTRGYDSLKAVLLKAYVFVDFSHKRTRFHLLLPRFFRLLNTIVLNRTFPKNRLKNDLSWWFAVGHETFSWNIWPSFLCTIYIPLIHCMVSFDFDSSICTYRSHGGGGGGVNKAFSWMGSNMLCKRANAFKLGIHNLIYYKCIQDCPKVRGFNRS